MQTVCIKFNRNTLSPFSVLTVMSIRAPGRETVKRATQNIGFIYCGISAKHLQSVRITDHYLNLSKFFSQAPSVLQLVMPASRNPVCVLTFPIFTTYFFLDHETIRYSSHSVLSVKLEMTDFSGRRYVCVKRYCKWREVKYMTLTRQPSGTDVTTGQTVEPSFNVQLLQKA